MPLQKLDIVNQMLGLQGERPINSLDSTHPSLPGALLYLDSWDAQVQATRWWFNTETATLTPQLGTGYIKLPNNALAFDILDRVPNLTVRGDKLYNPDEQTFVFTAAVTGVLHRLVPFDDLPILARAYIGAKAKLAFQNNYDADPVKTQALNREVGESFANLNAEHTRVVAANMFNRPAVARALANIRGSRYTAGGTRRRWS